MSNKVEDHATMSLAWQSGPCIAASYGVHLNRVEQFQRFNPKLRWLGGLLDAAYSAASTFRASPRAQGPLSKITPEKVLVVESHLIGDTVLLIPVLDALRRRFSSAKIHVLGNPWIRDVLAESHLADRLIVQKIPWATYDYSPSNLRSLWHTIKLLRNEHYDLAIDPRGDARNCVLLWTTNAARRLGFGLTGAVRYLTDIAPAPAEDAPWLEAKYKVLEPLGVYGPPRSPLIACAPEPYNLGKTFTEALKRAHGGPVVAIHATGSQAQRRIAPSKELELLHALLGVQVTPVLIGSPAEEARLSSLADRLEGRVAIFTKSLPEALGLLANVDALIAIDSGPAHLAAALGTRTVVIVEQHKAGITTPRGKVVLIPMPSSKLSSGIAAADALCALVKLGVLDAVNRTA